MKCLPIFPLPLCLLASWPLCLFFPPFFPFPEFIFLFQNFLEFPFLLFCSCFLLYFLDCYRRTTCASQCCSPFALWLWSAIMAFKELYLNLCPVLIYVNRIQTSILLTLLFQRAERCHNVLNYKIVDGLGRSTWPLSRKNWNLIACHWKQKGWVFKIFVSVCEKEVFIL